MQCELVVRVPGTEPAARAVEGPLTLGGSRADGILVPGFPPAALQLEPRAAGLVLCPAAPGLHVAGRAVAPGGRRLLQPGERASWGPVTLELTFKPTSGPPPARPESTRLEAAAVLRGALSDSSPPPGPHLVVLTGRDAGARVPVAPEVLIGRGRGADLRLDDPTISRRHARLRLGPGGAVLEDLGAKNRLRVNGVPAERRPVSIRPGDRITLGETELAFHGRLPRTDPSLPDAGVAAPPARAGRVKAAAGLRPLLVAALLAFSAAALALASSLG